MKSKVFDVKSYLADREIRYWTEGKNVKPGWVNITCPFCGDHGYSGNNHLGISSSRFFNCWICGETGGIIKLIRELEGVGEKEAKKIYSSWLVPVSEDGSLLEEGERGLKRGKLVLPPDIHPHPLPIHKRYIKKRGLVLQELIDKYDIRFGHTIGRYRFCLIAPLRTRGTKRWMTFVAADVTRKRIAKYMDHDRDKSVLSTMDLVYNLENLRGNTAVAVEGLVDCWKVGDGAIATMGTRFTRRQLKLMVDSGIKRLFTLYDSGGEALERAKALARMAAPLMEYTEILELDEGDPGDMSQQDVFHLKKEIGLI